METRQMTWEEWVEKFNPKLDREDLPRMYETYGEDVEHVIKHDDNLIWTYLEGDSGSVITQGYHYVNRLGYYLTSVPWEPDVEYEVDYYEYTDDNEED